MKRFLAFDQGLCFVPNLAPLDFLDKNILDSIFPSVSCLFEKNLSRIFFRTCLALSLCHPLISNLKNIRQYCQHCHIWGNISREASISDLRLLVSSISEIQHNAFQSSIVNDLLFFGGQLISEQCFEWFPVLKLHVCSWSDIVLCVFDPCTAQLFLLNLPAYSAVGCRVWASLKLKPRGGVANWWCSSNSERLLQHCTALCTVDLE